MTSAATTEIERVERALYDAMIAKDFAMLEHLLDPELAYVHSTAVTETRSRYLAGVARGAYEYETIAMPGARIRVHGPLATIDGVCEMRVGAAGAPKDALRLQVILVWRKTGDHWRLLYRQATRLPPDARGNGP